MRKGLVDQMKQLASDFKVRYIEIRSMHQFRELNELGFIEKCPLLISELPLKSLDDNWEMLSPKHRRNVRIAQKKRVIVKLASSLNEMKVFYEILADHCKQLGSPFFDEKFFIQIWNKLVQKKYGCLLLAKLKEEIIGGHLLFFSGKSLISKYSACKKNKEYKKVYASYALYWEGIRLGINNNLINFNLGVTEKSLRGLLDFKSRFGSQNSPLYFYYYSISGGIPDFSKYFSKYSLLKKTWRAAPRFLTSPIGQKINQWIC